MMMLQSAIVDFLRHCQFEKNLSGKTLNAYETDLRQLNNFLCKQNYETSLEKLTKKELREFIASLANLKPKSIKRKLASLKAMFNYLEFEDHILINPFRKMRINIKEGKALPRVIELKEIFKMFALAYKVKSQHSKYAYTTFEALRNTVVMELLFSTGARVSEIASLHVTKMNLENGSVRFQGKGNKERLIQICNKETLSILKTYSKQYADKIETAGGYFLTNRFNNRLSDQSIRGIVKKIAEEAGLNKHITPHMFRHSFATLLLEKDVDIKYIQTLLGHSSIMTTQIYTHVNAEKQKRILTTKHPRKDFNLAS
jgi:integrase/recombinase XerD